MKRPVLVEAILFVVLLAVGVSLRVWLQYLPNFAPVAAISLFAGYFFRSWLVAASLPIMIMGISDQLIGGYPIQMMLLVHASLTLPVLCRGVLRRLSPIGDARSMPRLAVGAFAGSLASCVFFLVTNFGSWLSFDMYEQNLTGLTHCYVNALPFFRYTLLGDLSFATVLFGGYATAVVSGLIADESVASRPAVSVR